MTCIVQSLQLLSPVITGICQISGAAGTSIGVTHHDNVIHRANFRYQDIENKVAPDSNTMYINALIGLQTMTERFEDKKYLAMLEVTEKAIKQT